MNVSPSPVTLVRVENAFWWSFVSWSVLGIMAMLLELGSGPLPPWFSPGDVGEVLSRITPWADFIWVCLASLTSATLLLRLEGHGSLRTQSVIIILMAGSIEWIGAITGFPFGARDYGNGLGPLVEGTLPYVIPLLWFVIVVSARYCFYWWPRGRGWIVGSIGVGILAMLTALSLEPVASGTRDYWQWRTGSYEEPGDRYWKVWYPLTWFVGATAMTFFSGAKPDDEARNSRSARRLGFVFLLMHGLLLSVHLGKL